jgi:hypothetical protein
VAVLLLLAMFWDPAWLDGSPYNSIAPRFVRPVSTRPAPAATHVSNAPQADAAIALERPEVVDAGLPTTSDALQPPRLVVNDSLPTSAATPADPSRVEPASASRVETGDRSDDDGNRRRPADTSLSTARTLVVDAAPDPPHAAGELVVGDLAEACRLAQQNSAIRTIQLRHQGRLETAPLVFRLEDRTLKLAAAEGYAPILSFRTGTSVSDFESEGMIQVTGGQLQLDGIHLEMTVPNETLDGEWSLFQLSDASWLRIRRSTLSIHNSYGGRFSNLDNVAVFNCILPDRNDMLDPDMGQPRESTRVELEDCVIRCEATVLRARDAIPIRFQWTNGLLVTSERLASLHGAAQIPRDGEKIELLLRQLTAVVDQGLAELTASPARSHLMPLMIDSRQCIWTTQRWATLITQSGPHSRQALTAQLAYRGERNAYEGMESFWKINPLDAAQTESLDFDMWQAHWGEDSPTWQQVPWRYPLDKNRPIHEQRIVDYALTTDEPLVGDDASIPIGLQADSLPSLPDPDRSQPRKTRPFFQY